MILRLWFFFVTWTRSKPPPQVWHLWQKNGFFFEGFPYCPGEIVSSKASQQSLTMLMPRTWIWFMEQPIIFVIPLWFSDTLRFLTANDTLYPPSHYLLFRSHKVFILSKLYQSLWFKTNHFLTYIYTKCSAQLGDVSWLAVTERLSAVCSVAGQARTQLTGWEVRGVNR